HDREEQGESAHVAILGHLGSIGDHLADRERNAKQIPAIAKTNQRFALPGQRGSGYKSGSFPR
ncbi:MAG: hypothetical protein KJO84_01570, partial [Acidimicrobiia bacterium]|nr:hypothetical protein [Acidimicrobiia bacterium]